MRNLILGPIIELSRTWRLMRRDLVRMFEGATVQKRLREEIAAVEKEIESHSGQTEQLNKRLEGLKRAVDLVESEQPAIAELLRANLADRNGALPEIAAQPTATRSKAASSRKQISHKAAWSPSHNGRGKTKTAQARPIAPQGESKRRSQAPFRIERSPPDLWARQRIWLETTESSATVHLYTNPRRFAHTKADRCANRLVTWSLKSTLAWRLI